MFWHGLCIPPGIICQSGPEEEAMGDTSVTAVCLAAQHDRRHCSLCAQPLLLRTVLCATWLNRLKKALF